MVLVSALAANHLHSFAVINRNVIAQVVTERDVVPAIQHEFSSAQYPFQDGPELLNAFILGLLLFCHGSPSLKQKAQPERIQQGSRPLLFVFSIR